MITRFKIFERQSYEIYGELVDNFDDDFIEEYYDKNLAYDDIEEILGLWPNIIWNHVDDDAFVQSWIEDEISNLSIEDFSDYDYKDYLEFNWNDEIENEAFKVWKENHEDENDDDKYSEYSGFMIDDLSEDELKEIIKNIDEENEFVEKVVNDRYDREDAQGIIKGIYGNVEGMSGEELYNILSDYIDDDDIIKDYKDNEDFDYKKDTIGNNIIFDKDLQEKLLEISKKNIIALVELFVEEGYNKEDNIITDEPYKMQKLYIKKYSKKNKHDHLAKAKALKTLDENFELDEDIKKEFHEDLLLMNAIDSADKFNI